MRKAVFIILSVCIVVAIFASTLVLTGNRTADSEEQATASPQTISSIVVWNKNRDQKVFETKDTDVLNAVGSLIGEAAWIEVSEPEPLIDTGREYILSVYNQSGQASEFTMIHLENNDISLIKQSTASGGAYEKADFTGQGGEGSLGEYLKINNVQ